MRGLLLIDARYPAAWVTSFAPIPAGSVVEVSPARNLPPSDNIKYWIESHGMADDAYGIGLGAADVLLVGDRVRLTKDVERFPHFTAPKGSLGVVTFLDNGLLHVQMDTPLENAEEWDNNVIWNVGDGDLPVNDLEKIQ